MKRIIDKPAKIFVIILFLISVFLFVMGITHPIMGTEVILGLKSSEIFLTDSIQYFYKRGEWIMGTILLTFTFILPILKYIFISIQLMGFTFPRALWVGHILNMINKWAMLDVYIVALLIMTLRFDSNIIDHFILIGTTYFACSIVLLMTCSYWATQIREKQKLVALRTTVND